MCDRNESSSLALDGRALSRQRHGEAPMSNSTEVLACHTLPQCIMMHSSTAFPTHLHVSILALVAGQTAWPDTTITALSPRAPLKIWEMSLVLREKVRSCAVMRYHA